MFIIGAGGLASQIVDVLELLQIPIDGFYDDQKTGQFMGYPILGPIENIKGPAICGIGNNSRRREIINLFPTVEWSNVIHPQACVSKHANLGIGNYIGPMACIMPGASVGNHNIVDPGAVISHDSLIKDFNHLASHATLLGRVNVGSENLIGSHATVLPDLIIGNRNIIGAGAVITKSVYSESVMLGIPARKK